MSCDLTIANVENMTMVCGSECGFLMNPNNTYRINKSEVSSYSADDSAAPAEYKILFNMKSGVSPLEWSFATETERDAALAKVDAEMNTKVM